jgi:hypothetical protein
MSHATIAAEASGTASFLQQTLKAQRWLLPLHLVALMSVGQYLARAMVQSKPIACATEAAHTRARAANRRPCRSMAMLCLEVSQDEGGLGRVDLQAGRQQSLQGWLSDCFGTE